MATVDQILARLAQRKKLLDNAREATSKLDDDLLFEFFGELREVVQARAAGKPARAPKTNGAARPVKLRGGQPTIGSLIEAAVEGEPLETRDIHAAVRKTRPDVTYQTIASELNRLKHLKRLVVAGAGVRGGLYGLPPSKAQKGGADPKA